MPKKKRRGIRGVFLCAAHNGRNVRCRKNYFDMDRWNIRSRRSVFASQQDCEEFAVVSAWLAVL
jgi:hypothetical protein